MKAKLQSPLRFGVVGLGVGASSVLQVISDSPYSTLGGGADIEPLVRQRISARYPDIATYASVEELCEDPNLDAIWISTPNRFHAEHAVLAAERGKHVIVSKPMATSIAESDRMIEAAARHGVKLLAGHSLGFGPAVRAMARVSANSSKLGAVRSIQMTAYTDWMLLPRGPDEVNPDLGGGLVHRQSPHQIDAARLLGGGLVRSVRAVTGQWMPTRPGPGFFSAFLEFENGAVATVAHNGYGYLVGPELVPWGTDAGITGLNAQQRAALRQRIGGSDYNEDTAKHEMRLGGSAPLFSDDQGVTPWVPLHLGLTIVSCERGDLRHAPDGVFIYHNEGRTHARVPDDMSLGLSELEELYRSVVEGAGLFRDGEWGRATLEVTSAIIQSARTSSEVRLRHQVPVRPGALDKAAEIVF